MYLSEAVSKLKRVFKDFQGGFFQTTMQLKNVQGNTCVELLSAQTNKVKLRQCDPTNAYQQWKVSPTK